MNWKYPFIGSLIFSTILTGIYFSQEWTTMQELGGWNMVILLVIIGGPSFTYFSWVFQAVESDSNFEEYNKGYLKSIYHSFLDQLSEDPENRDLLLSIYEAGKSYYSLINEKDWEEKIKKDIETSIIPIEKVA